MRRFIPAGLLLAALLAACGPNSSSSIHVSASESAAAHAARQRGIVIVTKCSDGKIAAAAIINHSATLKQYLTAGPYLKDPANRAHVWACASTQPGSASIPGANVGQKIENCWTTSPAETAAIDHPVHAAHHAKDTAAALVDAAVVCAGKAA